MKSLIEYLNESVSWTDAAKGLTEQKSYIKYDPKRHITGVDFGRLTNEGDNNILNDIEKAGFDMLISPEEEEFDYQWMNIYWDKYIIEFYMPNNFTNGVPIGFNFNIKINKNAMERWLGGNHEWKAGDFNILQTPGIFTKIPNNMDIVRFNGQLCSLVAMIMNRQPEPLW